MKQRCTNPRHPKFSTYGAVGIGFDPRWRTFENFLADMGEMLPGTTLDRIDNAKGYSPGNCRWATRKRQQRNRNMTVHCRYQGQDWVMFGNYILDSRNASG